MCCYFGFKRAWPARLSADTVRYFRLRPAISFVRLTSSYPEYTARCRTLPIPKTRVRNPGKPNSRLMKPESMFPLP